MKLMWASCCNDLVTPHRKAKATKSCHCGKCLTWWDDPYTGKLGVCAQNYEDVSVVGLHNGLLTSECSAYVDKVMMEEILKNTETNYLFKTMNSLVIRFKPGNTIDTRFIQWEKFKEEF